MSHQVSSDDREFQRAFEACEIPESDFDHRAHVRLAYIYLCQGSADQAHDRMKRSLLRFLRHLGAAESKYHETVTRAWIMAVKHFMELSSAGCDSAEAFIDQNQLLLDSKVMLQHYSAEVLFSPTARSRFVDPDIEPIPEH